MLTTIASPVDRANCIASGYCTDSARVDPLGLAEGTVHTVRSLGIHTFDHLLCAFVQEPARDGFRR
jgi:hypothetical protein